jgi:hypothetical protein
VVVSRLVNGDIPTSPKAVNPQTPDALDEICRKALAPKMEERYANASDFQEALEQYIRSTGEHVAQRELGTFVTNLFKERRDEMKVVVERQLAELKSKPAAAFAIAHLEPTSVSNPTLRSLAVNIDSANVEGVISAKTSSDPVVASSRPAPQKRSPAQLGVGVALLVLAGVGAYIGISRSAQQAPAAAAASEVRLQVRALPASATMSLDGDRRLENPFIGMMPRDGKSHRLVIEAPGFKRKEQSITFDHDVVLDVSLEPEPTVAQGSPDPEPTTEPSAKAAPGPVRPAVRPRPPRGQPPDPPATSAAPAPPPPPSGKPKRKLDDGEMWDN